MMLYHPERMHLMIDGQNLKTVYTMSFHYFYSQKDTQLEYFRNF